MRDSGQLGTGQRRIESAPAGRIFALAAHCSALDLPAGLISGHRLSLLWPSSPKPEPSHHAPLHRHSRRGSGQTDEIRFAQGAAAPCGSAASVACARRREGPAGRRYPRRAWTRRRTRATGARERARELGPAGGATRNRSRRRAGDAGDRRRSQRTHSVRGCAAGAGRHDRAAGDAGECGVHRRADCRSCRSDRIRPRRARRRRQRRPHRRTEGRQHERACDQRNQHGPDVRARGRAAQVAVCAQERQRTRASTT